MKMGALVSFDIKTATFRRYERSDDGKSFRLTHRCEAIAGAASVTEFELSWFRRNPNPEFVVPAKTFPLSGGDAA